MGLREEIDVLAQSLEASRQETVARLDELQAIRDALEHGGKDGELRAKVHALKRNGGGESRAKKPVRGAEVTVRMKTQSAPLVGQTQGTRASKGPPVRLVVQGTLQRQLAELDSRIVDMMLEADDGQRPGEIYLLCDLRAGLQSVLESLPEHDVLLGLVHDYTEQVEAINQDLSAGGQRRAKRLLDHDRELASRLKALAKSDPKNSSLVGAAGKFDARLEASKKKLDGAPGSVEPLARELEDLLFSMHKELEGHGFGGAGSLLFSALEKSAHKRPPQ